MPVVPAEADQDAVLPQEVRLKKPAARRVPSTRAIRPGDRICGDCGEGNPPARKYCSRCGESLAAIIPVAPRWWHRLRPRRGPKVVKASKRPTATKAGGRRPRRRIGTAIRRYSFVVFLAAALIAGVYPPWRTYVVNKVDEARAAISGTVATALEPVRPTAVRPTDTQLAGHPAKMAFDQFGNTHWAAAWSPEAKQPAVTVDMGKATALAKVIVTSGAADDFAAHHRPSILLFTYSNEQSDTIGLQDTPEPQQFSLRNGLAARVVQIQVVQVFETEGAEDVALTEIEFFGAG